MKWRVPLLSLGMFVSGLDGADGCDGCETAPPPPGNGEYTVSVVAVRLADDDGSSAATLTQAQFQSYMDTATKIYRESGAKLTFVVAPESNFDSVVKSTYLNHDCAPQTNDPGQYTDPNKDPNEICDKSGVGDARNAYALQWPTRLVIFLRYYADAPEYKDGHWTINKRQATGGYSSGTGHFVAGVGWKSGSTFYAHEMGHYLHLPHPFGGSTPTTVAEAEADVTAYIKKQGAGFDITHRALNLWNGDSISDTPPDPHTTLFKNLYGDACTPDHDTVPISVTVSGVKYDLTIAPDRHNVMSYYKGCPWNMRITPLQRDAAVASLETGNRQRLVRPDLQSCYESSGIASARTTAARLAIIDDCLSSIGVSHPAAAINLDVTPVCDTTLDVP